MKPLKLVPITKVPVYGFAITNREGTYPRYRPLNKPKNQYVEASSDKRLHNDRKEFRL